MLDKIRRKFSYSDVKVFYNKIWDLGRFEDLIYYRGVGSALPHMRCTQKKSNKSFRYIYKTSEVVKLKDVEIKMISCPADIFIMGHIDQVNKLSRQEIIERPFLLGETEVTQELYQAVMEENPSKFKHPQNPVEQISWVDAILFCNSLSSLQGFDVCYGTRKTKVGILRTEMRLRDEEELVEYNNFYDSIRSYILERLEKNNPYNVELEIEYDPDISTCDVVVSDRNMDETYLIELNWVEGMKGKYSLNRKIYLGVKPYLLNKDAKKKLDELLEGCRIPIFECDFGKNGYRLPTEKEWEYAAKAGTQNQWAGTDNEEYLEDYATYKKNSRLKDRPYPVKTKKPNEWGFYDMGGNVWERCWDKYDPKDPKPSADRVFRGGCWYVDASYLLSAGRYKGSPDTSIGMMVGFRVCRSVVD